MAAPSRLRQNLFNFFVVSHLELPRAVLELVEYLHPPKVVESGSKGKMDSCLFVEVTSEIPKSGKWFSLSFGPLYSKHTRMDEERGEHPCQDDRSPSRMIGKQGQES